METKTPYPLRFNSLHVFLLLWIAIFVLYLPASQAGRVGDFPGWVTFLNSVGFVDYINRSESGIRSLYQFTQIITYVFYRIFGANAWLWHLLYVTLHAVNAFLLYTFGRRMLNDSGVKRSMLIAAAGALLFAICPQVSEVVVWEPAFHFLLGFLLMLIVLLCAQGYLRTEKIKFAWWGGFVFFLSTYSLEVFYLTPFFVIVLAVYYSFVVGKGRKTFLKLLRDFTLPQALIFIAYFVVLHLMYHGTVAHISNKSLEFGTRNFSKPLKYIFHIVFFGRFFPEEVKKRVYTFCESARVLYSFYGMVVLLVLAVLARFKRMSKHGKALVTMFVFALLALILIIPLWLPESGLVIYDRYTYVLNGFFYMWLALLVGYIGSGIVFGIVIAAYAVFISGFTRKVNAYWYQSAKIVNNLVYTFPNDPSKTVLLLDLPECLNGVQMVGSRDDGEFFMMYNAIMPHRLTNTVYDVEAFYMLGADDAAHVNVISDSSLHVTLNRWGCWWLYYGFGATNYETKDYRVIMHDVGHSYEVVLKHPYNQYLLLYQAGGIWKQVDMTRKNVDQF